MKKQLVLAAGLAVLATPALATKARLIALGEDANGSFYINDNRNIFLNASEVLNHKDLVTFEWGAAQTTDTGGDSNAEGGFLRASGNMVWGAQMGRVTDFASDYQAAITQAGGGLVAFSPNNVLDLFIGGDAGIKWGAQLTYANRKDDAFNDGGGADDANADQIDLAVGVSSGNIAGYLKYGVSGKIETDGSDIEVSRKTPIELGVSYKWMEYTFFGQYEGHSLEVESATDSDVDASSWQIGAGRSTKLSDKATLYTKVAYVNSEKDWDDLGTTDEANSKQLPVTIGLEYDAASWLALRGSIAQSVLINENDNGDDKSTASTTNVNAGASLKFGDLSVDGVIGTNGGAEDTETGTFNTDNLMTRVSMTYRF